MEPLTEPLPMGGNVEVVFHFEGGQARIEGRILMVKISHARAEDPESKVYARTIPTGIETITIIVDTRG